ncbi:uncharacterized protein EI90DRAFT_3184936 [Cantharellus anzutake]|uniref:uncharacterized protein n=1 Tax=Cantharellus anzutake TaxID=1750568 RepID=UPI0019039BC9|nr:uncharacterized protein EI90DRAFT_3184936 [Cantharellus anzutake]KAF8312897.1 hypothetical protein EI90DRAFT_3184936 [Cantharellus anzutake]
MSESAKSKSTLQISDTAPSAVDTESRDDATGDFEEFDIPSSDEDVDEDRNKQDEDNKEQDTIQLLSGLKVTIQFIGPGSSPRNNVISPYSHAAWPSTRVEVDGWSVLMQDILSTAQEYLGTDWITTPSATIGKASLGELSNLWKVWQTMEKHAQFNALKDSHCTTAHSIYETLAIVKDTYMEFQNNPQARCLESVWDNEPVKDLKYAYDDPNSETKVHSLQEIITYLKYLKANGVEPNQNKKSNVYLPFKLRNVFIVFVLLCFLPMVYASTAMGLAETFTSATPRITGYAMAVILIFILRNGEYLHHHYLQSQATLNPNFPSSWIRRLSAHLFSQDSLALPQLDQKTQNYLILEAANGLGLSHEFLSDPHLIHPQPTLLGPSYFDCQTMCGYMDVGG